MSEASFSFTVYMIHAMADYWDTTPCKAYKLLSESGCITNYLVKHYDVLHTQGTQYLAQDVNEYLVQRGYAL